MKLKFSLIKPTRSLARVLSAASLAVLLGSCQISDVLRDGGLSKGLSEQEIISGLKEALLLGSKKSALDLGAVDGYMGNALVKILLPEDVATVFDQVSKFDKQCGGICKELGGAVAATIMPLRDSILLSLNRGAERAAPQSVDIFTQAITSMSISEGRDILFGDDSVAATKYLNNATRASLQELFSPVIRESLDAVKANVYWERFAKGYNQILGMYTIAENSNGLITLPALDMPDSLAVDLGGYTTTKALDGLFSMVEIQEANLRADPLQVLDDLSDLIDETAGDLLEKVFTAEE